MAIFLAPGVEKVKRGHDGLSYSLQKFGTLVRLVFSVAGDPLVLVIDHERATFHRHRISQVRPCSEVSHEIVVGPLCGLTAGRFHLDKT
ncbi:hypothetical protein SZ60_09290 [Frigoribacterium sp. MEB024]|nr:hypothetical protein SZ60_09290 [Frigoribacterium sp. MEB024]